MKSMASAYSRQDQSFSKNSFIVTGRGPDTSEPKTPSLSIVPGELAASEAIAMTLRRATWPSMSTRNSLDYRKNRQ